MEMDNSVMEQMRREYLAKQSELPAQEYCIDSTQAKQATSVDNEQLANLAKKYDLNLKNLTTDEKQALQNASQFDLKGANFHIIGNHVQGFDTAGHSALITIDQARKIWGRSQALRQELSAARHRQEGQMLTNHPRHQEISPQIKSVISQLGDEIDQDYWRRYDFADKFYQQHPDMQWHEDVDFIALARALETAPNDTARQTLLSSMPDGLKKNWQQNQEFWTALAHAKNRREAAKILVKFFPNDAGYKLELDMMEAIDSSSTHEEAFQKMAALYPEDPTWQSTPPEASTPK